MPELAYLNGEIMALSEAKVPIEDRGYQFGDAVYEVIVGHKGRLFALEPHMDRLMRSMSELGFPKLNRHDVAKEIDRFYQACELPEAMVYVQISRGVSPRNHSIPKGLTPQISMTAKPVHALEREYRENGIRTITFEDIRWGRCDIKATLLLPNTLAKQAAKRAGCFDAIFVSKEGVVREATSSNVFVIKDGVMFTHPLTHNILPGITRGLMIEQCNGAGIAVREEFFDIDFLLNADEVFLTGTLTEILSVVEIDGRKIGEGKPGPYSRKIDMMLQESMFA